MMQGGAREFVAVSEQRAVKQTPDAIRRRRWPYLALALLVLVFGLSVRTYSSALPTFVGAYAPDALWALLVFLLVAAVNPCRTTQQTAWIASAFAYGIEFSQLYQAPWINVIRNTRLGGLVFGHGFLLSDLVCYTVGISMGALLAK